MIRNRTSTATRRASGISIARDNILYIIESFLGPCVVVFTLWGIAFWDEGNITPSYFILSIILFSLTFPSGSKISHEPWRMIRNTMFNWVFLAGLILLFGRATGFINLFSYRAMELWLWLTPVSYLLAIFLLRTSAPMILKLQGPVKRAIIAGLNDQGNALAESFLRHEYTTTTCQGYFDDRAENRLSNPNNLTNLGKISEIADYVKQHKINVIYLSLPMVSQPRILKLLEELHDTTASVYILPDIFLTDLIQGRIGQVDGIPVMAVCESPFTGTDSFIKRTTDILLALIILILISPILFVISLGVKFSSPGPIIFKQRRYGIDGKEILVYKFRSMTTTDNGNEVAQATKNDARITPLGGFLRKTSLDELPQFFNVLQGRMSIVGPRPHAVAHNEMYRKVIKGYMIRHKVKPGITGWAQVNGLRGETDTLDKMQARIEYDIDYLRHWSLRLDIYIILKTIWVVVRGQDGAY
ncbi:MAG: undecaprenyl-phosphate glucose phosphotransferase [Methylotenera sp.]|nr:undecaprenyl-phosphate glucose phosphotransferase [Methylotenera sp.]